MKKNSKSNKKDLLIEITLFLITTIIFYFAPYTHDDWAWGGSLGLERLASYFKDYNGRWVGNLVVLLLTRCRILKAFVTSITLYLIVKLIKKLVNIKNDHIAYIAMILLMLMPYRIFAQALAWTSGFSNYTISFLLTMIFIYLNRNIFKNEPEKSNKKLIIPLLILGFVSALFLENLTIYNIVLAIFVVGYQLFKNKKINISNFAYLIGSISGAILMFSNGAYHNISNAGDEYRTIAQDSIIMGSIQKYFNLMYKYIFRNNYVINAVIGVLFLIVIYKYLKKNNKLSKIKKTILCLTSLVLIGYLGYTSYVIFNANLNVFIYENYRNYFEGLISILFFIALIIGTFTVTDKEKRNRLLFYLASIVILTGPLFIVTPIGPRNFFQNYVLFTLIACELIDYLYNKNDINIKYALVSATTVVIMCYFIVFGYIFKADMKRISTINNSSKEETVLRIPKMPHPAYMQGPDPVNEVFLERFKDFYHIPENTEIKLVGYKKNQNIAFKEKGTFKLEVLKRKQLHLTGEKVSVTYTSNHPDIINVNNVGQIKALRPGNAVITAKNIYNKEAKIRVTATLNKGFITDEMLKKANANKYENLMIVAHPDDETLWGGAHLKDSNYFVICLTNGYNKTRSKEFKKLLKFTNNSGLILNYPDMQDGIRDDWTNANKGLKEDLTKLITYKNWKTIVTHSPDGGTGHIHHKLASKEIASIADKNNRANKLYYFGPFYKKGNIPSTLKRISDEEVKYKDEELKIYKSVKNNISKYWYHMVPYEKFISDDDWSLEEYKSEETFKMEEYEIESSSISVNGLEPGYQVALQPKKMKIRVTNRENERKELLRKELNPAIDVSGLSEGTHIVDLTVNSKYALSENVKITVEIKTITKTM